MSIILVDLGGPCMLAHVPKTGGTSIRFGRQLSSARMYRPDPGWLDLPCFGIVRDPFERIASCWKDFYHLRRMTTLCFERFVEWIIPRIEDETLVRRPETIEHHAARQTHPVHGIAFATDIGNTETLQWDFNNFCTKHNLSSFPLKQKRATKGFLDPEWTKALRQQVEKAYMQDFAFVEALKCR